jgi:hypothetical protein
MIGCMDGKMIDDHAFMHSCMLACVRYTHDGIQHNKMLR